MELISGILPYIQIVLSILLVITIILQQRGSSIGGAFGGGDSGTAYTQRRGAEKFLFQASIVLGILFAISAFVALLL